MAALTMAHIAKLETDPLKKMILMNIQRFGKILEYVPFQEVQGLRQGILRWTNLPDVAFRAINSEYSTSSGDVEQVYDNVYVFGGEIELDRIYDKIKGSLVQDPEKLQLDMMSKSMAYHWNDNFVNGNHGTDVNSFNGLSVRIDNGPSSQKVNVTTATGTALDPTGSAGNARLFLDRWEEAMYKANDGDIDLILCNRGLKWGLGRVLRFAGISGGPLLDVTKDQFDREVLTYKGAPLIDAGLKKDQSTEIITDTETAGDGGSDATSAYFIPFNEEQGVTGIQLSGGMEIYDGRKDKSNAKVKTIEWVAGLAGYGSYGPVRLWNIEAPGSWT